MWGELATIVGIGVLDPRLCKCERKIEVVAVIRQSEAQWVQRGGIITGFESRHAFSLRFSNSSLLVPIR